jgi:hypothetical protein
LDVEKVHFGIVDQQNLEEKVVFVDCYEGLGVEGVERTRKLDNRFEFGYVIHPLRSLLQDVIHLFFVVVEL